MIGMLNFFVQNMNKAQAKDFIRDTISSNANIPTELRRNVTNCVYDKDAQSFKSFDYRTHINGIWFHVYFKDNTLHVYEGDVDKEEAKHINHAIDNQIGLCTSISKEYKGGFPVSAIPELNENLKKTCMYVAGKLFC